MDYNKLIKDFNNGTINRKTTKLVVDNDHTFFSVDTGDDDRDYEIASELKKKYGTGYGQLDIVDVLEAAGVRAERC